MPFGLRKLIHLGQRLMYAVLAQDVQARDEGFAAHRDVEAFGNGDDSDVVGIAAGATYTFANRGEVSGNAHRIATIAPNRVPSGWRR